MLLQDSPLDLLASPVKNGYYGDPVLEAALEDDSDDLDDLIIAKQWNNYCGSK